MCFSVMASRDLSRRALEEFKSVDLTETELQRLLGFGTRYKLGRIPESPWRDDRRLHN